MNLKQLFSKMMFWRKPKRVVEAEQNFMRALAAYQMNPPTNPYDSWNPNTYPDKSQWVAYAVYSVPEVTCNFDAPKQDFKGTEGILGVVAVAEIGVHPQAMVVAGVMTNAD